MDGFSGSRQENVEDRQGAINRPLSQLALHVLSDEETEVEQRTQRALKILQLAANDKGTDAHQLGDISYWFETGQHVRRGGRKERGRVKEIRSAEHVQHRAVFVGQ